MIGMPELATFGFGAPALLPALLVPVLATWAWWAGRRGRRAARLALGGAPALHGGASERRRSLAAFALIAGIVLAVIASARPQWGEGNREIAQSGIDIVVALDVSRSMEAQDIAPSRAEAASVGLAEMLGHLTGNRVGLVTFAGSAFERAPLTVDLQVLVSLIARSQVESALVQPGTDLAAAIESALDVLDVEDPAAAQAIVLVSDGEDPTQEIEDAIARAEAAGIPIYTVFAGTTNPTPLPETSGGTDVSVGQPDILKTIAGRTGADARSAAQIPGLAVEFRRLQQTQFNADTERQPVDRFVWFAGAALVLVVVAWVVGEGGSRRMPRLRGGAIVASMLALVVIGCGTSAWRHIEAGNAAYKSGDYEDALSEYRQAGEASPDSAAANYNIANALHQLERYEEAAAAAGESHRAALDAEDIRTASLAQYTLGNTAFVRQQLEAARDAYISALRLNPDDRDAKANLELTLALLLPPPDPDPGEPQPGEGTPDPVATPDPDATAQPGDPGPGPADPSATAEPGDGTSQPGQPQPSEPQPGQGEGDPRQFMIEAARVDLAEALGELGPEVTAEEAQRIIDLTRRLNELEGLPSGGAGSVPAR